MPGEVILPRVDMDMATGKISKWFVESGGTVVKGQPLFEIETDKAAMEIEAPFSGRIRDLAAASGEDIPVGSVVAWIDAEGETPARIEQAPSDAAQRREGREKPRATPLARRIARLKGIDLAALTGRGPRGRVQASDVAAAARCDEARERPSPDVIDPVSPVSAETPSLRSDARRLDRRAASAASATISSAVPRLLRLRDGSGTPLALVHGFGADADAWRPFIAGLRLNRPIYAVDLPGHGSSSLGSGADFDSLVDGVEAAFAAADLPDIDIVGHSLGAAVAAALAARGAVGIRSLLLLSPAGLGPDINGGFIHGFLGASIPASLTPWLRQLVVDERLITPAFAASTLRARTLAGTVDDQRRIARTIFPDDTQSFSIRDDLGRLAIPARIVFGLEDLVIPARHIGRLPGLVATHLFPGVGHMPQMEVRDAVGAILMQMIAC